MGTWFATSVETTTSSYAVSDGLVVTASGGLISSANDAVVGDFSNSAVVVQGFVDSYTSVGLRFLSNTQQLTGESITVGAAGYIRGYTDGINITATNSWIRNEGVTFGYDHAIVLNANTGINRIVNNGSIMSNGEGIRGAGAQTLIVNNSGSIYSQTHAIGTYGGATALITNTGSIQGDLYLDSGNDVYQGTNGRLTGVIDCFSGNDTVYAGSDNDTINGMTGNDIINGGLGADTMSGGSGNDAFFVDNVGDVVKEINETGIDRVYSSVSFSLVGQYIENLTLTGSAAIGGTGNSLGNVITGNTGSNILIGLLGNDTLAGGAGKDFFRFNTAPNATTNVDRISDFSVADDTIQLENAVFTGLGTTTGTLNPALFVKNVAGVAADANDRIVYDTDGGLLYYDTNGNAAGGSTLIARLASNLALTAADFQVI